VKWGPLIFAWFTNPSFNKFKITVWPHSDVFFSAFLSKFPTICYHDTPSITNLPTQFLTIRPACKGLFRIERWSAEDRESRSFSPKSQIAKKKPVSRMRAGRETSGILRITRRTEKIGRSEARTTWSTFLGIEQLFHVTIHIALMKKSGEVVRYCLNSQNSEPCWKDLVLDGLQLSKCCAWRISVRRANRRTTPDLSRATWWKDRRWDPCQSSRNRQRYETMLLLMEDSDEISICSTPKAVGSQTSVKKMRLNFGAESSRRRTNSFRWKLLMFWNKHLPSKSKDSILQSHFWLESKVELSTTWSAKESLNL
jgi:hypothetical protein